MTERAKLLDHVVLRRDYGEWRAGTSGAVVQTLTDAAEVEIVGPDGRCLDLLTVAYRDLRVARNAKEQLAG
ncbi:MAG: hypothetical protein ACYDCQ_01555 [Dehalococcoidia bacterium]